MTLESFDNNEVICRQGDKGEKFYIILSGSVGVYIDMPAEN